MLDSLSHDFRYAWRALATHGRFTLLVAVTLALTIGASTTVLSIANAVLLRPLPYADSDRLVWLKTVREQSPLQQRASYPDFRDWRAATRTLDLVGHGGLEMVLLGAGEPERLHAELFVGDLFSLLGVAPALGSAARDDDTGPTAVLSHALWQRKFGGDSRVIGKAITLDDGIQYTVAAVMPAGFEYPIRAATRVDLWLPLARFNPALAENRSARLIEVLGRLRAGASLAEAQADLDIIAADLSARYADTNRGLSIRLVSALEEATGGVARGLALLCAAVGALLLVGCVNVASLWLARTIAREKELATRAALGAARSRIARQLMLESVLLAGLGGAGGMLLTHWGIRAAGSALAGTIPRAGELAVGADAFGIALAVSLLSGLLFGLVPAFGAARVASGALKEGARTSRGPRGRRSFAALVFAEMALATVLVAGGGLFIHSLLKLDRADSGFDPRNVLTFELTWPGSYRNPGDLFGRLRARLLEIPGVLAASTGLQLPDRGEALLDDTAPFARIEGRPMPAGERARVSSLTVQPGYFRALGIPLADGRDFREEDRAGTPRVALVNRSFAQAYLGGDNPLGLRLRLDSWTLGGENAAEIVGIVADVRHEGLRAEAEPMVYLPFAQWPSWSSPIVVKTQGDPLALVPAIREAVRAIDASLPVDDIATLEQRLAASLAQDRFRAWLLGAFSIVALALAAVGLFAVLSYTTARRVREIGIRMALGARAAEVARTVVAESMLPVAGGIALGVVGAALLFRVADSLLFEVATTDPMALAAAISIMLAVAALACAAPARRASRIDPAAALRGD
jgi:putative ABC transport system permease protein